LKNPPAYPWDRWGGFGNQGVNHPKGGKTGKIKSTKLVENWKVAEFRRRESS